MTHPSLVSVAVVTRSGHPPDIRRLSWWSVGEWKLQTTSNCTFHRHVDSH